MFKGVFCPVLLLAPLKTVITRSCHTSQRPCFSPSPTHSQTQQNLRTFAWPCCDFATLDGLSASD